MFDFIDFKSDLLEGADVYTPFGKNSQILLGQISRFNSFRDTW